MDKRNLKYYIYVLLIQLASSGSTVHVYAQERTFPSSSFRNLSYQEIQEQELEAIDKEDWEELSQWVNLHILKAKEENKYIEIARAYYYKIILEDPDIGLKYADSIIYITQGITHPNYPTIGYSLKGHIYFNLGESQLALENYLIAYNLALKKDNLEHQREYSLAIAAIRNINGQHYAAAELYKRSLKLLQSKPDFENQNYEEYLILLYNLAISHLRLQEVDSARIFAQRGIQKASAKNDKENFRDFVLLEAQVNFYDNQFGKAKDTLLKYQKNLEGTSRAIKLYYLGKIEETQNSKSAIKYYKEIDSIISVTNDPFIEIKEVYKQLIMHSVTENDKRKQVEYIEKLIYFDSILAAGKEKILNMTAASYDIPFYKYQKQKAEEQLETKGRFVLFAGFLAGLSSLSGLYFYIRSRRMKLKLKTLIEKGVEAAKFVKSSTNKKFTHPPNVPEDIRNDILKKLKRFEESERFLCKELDMSMLAEEFGTNTSYLSLIINHYKQMNFPNYLKDLRITVAIKQLPDDPILSKFNYQGLADSFGFKTGESFSKAFYNKTGVYPSKFINELKSRKSEGDL